jgi:hypothetical protein
MLTALQSMLSLKASGGGAFSIALLIDGQLAHETGQYPAVEIPFACSRQKTPEKAD